MTCIISILITGPMVLLGSTFAASMPATAQRYLCPTATEGAEPQVAATAMPGHAASTPTREGRATGGIAVSLWGQQRPGGNGPLPGDPNYPGGETPLAPQPEPRPGGYWQERWGAIALDSKTGAAGTVEELDSQGAAENEALRRCANRGATGCRILTSYGNQCGAAAFGSQSVTAIGGKTAEQARAAALRLCSERSAECKIVYSGCSKSVFIAY